MNILTELDLTWIYFLYKAGNACAIIAVGLLLAMLLSFFCASESGNYKAEKLSIAMVIINCIGVPLLLGVTVITPDKDEVKGAAAYSLAKKVATSDKAGELYDRLMKALESKIGE